VTMAAGTDSDTDTDASKMESKCRIILREWEKATLVAGG